jgi:hypothetical protein
MTREAKDTMDGQDSDRNERVRAIAYLLWEEEGRPDGAAERHWAAAEARYDAVDPSRRESEGEPPGNVEAFESPQTAPPVAPPPLDPEPLAAAPLGRKRKGALKSP